MRPVIPFSHPGFERFRPAQAPEAQRVAATAEFEALSAAPDIDEVTTMIPRRGGAASMVGWRLEGGGKVPVTNLFVTPEGEVLR
jgi:hypothetical protein